MNDAGLIDLPIRNLEHIFTPPGLPLATKSKGTATTTSILVRGGAGTGKTTLAVALGQAIAQREGGRVLYLTTEFSQTELRYKARTLGLSADMVAAWSERAAAPPGAVLVEHLALSPGGEGPLTNAARKAGAIEALWALLHPEGGARDVQIGAVVIDAFTLPEPLADEKMLRSDLVAFVQALEGEGITTLVVEEATEEQSSWLPFVVDLVFELEWVADPDSGELHRKLRCPKSRYAQALAGPHDYGLDMGVPAVWPDLLAVAATSAGSGLRAPSPAAVFLPFNGGAQFVKLTSGGVVLSEKDHGGVPLPAILGRTPGVNLAEVRCGPLSVISGAAFAAPIQVPDAEGAQSLGWTLVQAARRRGVNAVLLHDPELLLRRRRFAVALLHVIEALRHVGVLVIVHASKEHLASLSSMGDVTAAGLVRLAREPRSFGPRRMRRVDMWLADVSGLGGSAPATDENREEFAKLQDLLQRAKGLLNAQNLPAARELLMHREAQPGGAGVQVGRSRLEAAALLHRLGETRSARDRAARSLHNAPALNDALAWAHALGGDDGPAAVQAVSSWGTGEASSATVLLWSSLCAVHAQSDTALAALARHDGRPEERLCIGYRLRALARRGHTLDVWKVAQRFGEQQQEPAWLIARMQEEAKLESPHEIDRREAFDRLAALQIDPALPVLHRADIAHNLGVVRERAEEADFAAGWYQDALALNPFLEAARDGLARLGVPAPEPPTASRA